MRAWILDESPGTYRLGEIAEPTLGATDVRVRVVASSLNHMDLWVTRALPRPTLPHVPGCDIAGVVSEVGPEVTTVSVGDEVVVNPTVSPLAEVVALGNDSPLGRGMRIVGEHRWGGHADYVTVPDRNVVARPANRSWIECAAYPLAYATAYRMLRRARVQAGHTVLVVGIGSGVSCAALAIALHMGCRVAVTSRSAEKRDAALALGAEAAYDSGADRWPIEADVVVESVGPATWEQSIRSLRPGGRLVVCGGTSGSTVELNLPRLFFKQIEIIGSTMASYEEFAQVTALVAQGVPVQVDSILPFTHYPEALNRLEHGQQLGKIVIDHGGVAA